MWTGEFEMPCSYLSGDVKEGVGYASLELREREIQDGDVSAGINI